MAKQSFSANRIRSEQRARNERLVILLSVALIAFSIAVEPRAIVLVGIYLAIAYLSDKI